MSSCFSSTEKDYLPVARAGNDVVIVLPVDHVTLYGNGSTDDKVQLYKKCLEIFSILSLSSCFKVCSYTRVVLCYCFRALLAMSGARLLPVRL